MERNSLSPCRAFAAVAGRIAAAARFGGLALLLAAYSTQAAAAPSDLTGRDAASADRIYLISTRGVGTRCDGSLLAAGFRCEEFVADEFGGRHWETTAWSEIAGQCAAPMPTVVFVHGNRIDPGVDKPHGLEIYRSLAARKPSDAPIRYIIWSWPSSKVPGMVKDYQVKAARTGPVAWQLAWMVDQLPAETPLTLVGYSFGGRVVTGALHLLAGGELGSLRLDERVHPVRPPMHAALLAAAVHASWIRPGSYHGRALEQVDQLLLVNNHLDPAMRFYHLAFEGHVRPLGYGGLSRASLGRFGERVQVVDTTRAVGRSHALGDYLTNATRVSQKLEQIVMAPLPTPAGAATSDEALAVGAMDVSAQRN
jgi:hypothetical protein